MITLKQRNSLLSQLRQWFQMATIPLLAIIITFSFTGKAMAHHPFGGTTPDTFLTAFLSGLGHPVIGFDHFAFVVASGLLAAGLVQGAMIPLAFVVAAMGGTGIHGMEVNLPAAETLIAVSVLGFGLLLAMNNSQENPPQSYSIGLAVLAAIAGIFHGYAYGESIVGAQMTPLVAYLVGFTFIQLIIAGAAYQLGNFILNNFSSHPFPIMRFIGLAIGGIGIVFLTNSLIG